jgi:hypothetical protein
MGLQNFFFYKFQVLCEIQISVGEKSTVCGVVIHFVEVDQFLVGQVGYVLGFSARIEFVLTFFEKIFVYFMQKCVVWVAHGALHFVVNNALVLQATFRVIRDFKLYSMTFLAEVKVVQVGKEGAICVD